MHPTLNWYFKEKRAYYTRDNTEILHIRLQKLISYNFACIEYTQNQAKR